MSRYLTIIAAVVYYIGGFYFVAKPLWFDHLRQNHSTATYDTNGSYKPVPLSMSEAGRRSIQFTAPTGLNLADLDTIDLFVGTYVQTLAVKDMVIHSQPGGCEYRSIAEVVRDNDYLHFHKGNCDRQSIAPGEKLVLSLTLEDHDKNMVIWSTTNPNKFAPKDVHTLTLSSPAGVAYPVGAIGMKFSSPFANRAALIARVWGPSLPAYSLQVLVGLLAVIPLFFLLGGLVTWTATTVTFVAALALMGLFTVIPPPLQAPDEATHFWNYVHLNGRDHLKDDILTDMNRSHYERVFCHDLEKLDSADLTQELKGSWPEHGFLLDLGARSLAGHKMWSLYDDIIGDGQPLSVLLKARALNTLIIASILAVGCCLLGCDFSASLGLVPLLSAMMLPTFWFFSGHLSNHTFVIAGYIAVMLLLLAFLHSERPARRTNFFSMALAVLCMSTGRASILTFSVAMLILLLGFLFNSKASKFYLVNLSIWSLVASFFAYYNQDSAYFLRIKNEVANFVENFSTKQLVVATCALLFILAMRRVIAKIPTDYRFSKGIINTLGSIIGVAFVSVLIVPALHKVNLPNIEFTPPPTQWRYVKLAFYTLFTNLGIGGDDFLVIRTRWGGFGCPDNFFPQGKIELFKFITIAGVSMLSFKYIFEGRFTPIAKIISIFVLLLGYYALLAAVCWQTGSTLHGRYLVGFASMVNVIATYGIYRLCVNPRSGAQSRPSVFLLVSSILAFVPFMTIDELIARYFV